ncbi:MAG: helix-turn-helix domain-containing protein [Gemmatimonadetes bacterium]|nr:helix-turn-helix domain-containing protein [Gemmatimonadota bacterium]
MAATSLSLAGFKGIRSDILVALRKEQPLTIKVLAARFGVTANALRRHLTDLVDAGLVVYRREIRGQGAPVFAYSLSEAGEALFPRAYVDPLVDALEALREREGTEAVVRLFRRRWESLAESARPRLATLPMPERAQLLAELLAAEGYMSEAVAGDGTAMTIRHHNCAVREIALRFPEVCSAEAEFIEAVLGSPVERRMHLKDGCSACEYGAIGRAPRSASASVSVPVSIPETPQ